MNSFIIRFSRLIKATNIFCKLNSYSLVLRSLLLKPDLVIIVKGFSINYELLEKYKISYSIYLWDSIENLFRNGGYYVNNASKVQSFDPDDCKKYGFQYLPLFHFRDADLSDLRCNVSKPYNFSIYGNYAPKRIDVLLKNEGLEIDHFITMPIVTFLIELFRFRIPPKILFKYIRIIPLKRKKIESLLSNSDFTIDIADANQSGMTMRTIEAMSHSTGLITNNLRSYEFFKLHGIPVILDSFDDCDLQKITVSFEDVKIDKLKESIIEYSIDSFIKKIIKYSLKK